MIDNNRGSVVLMVILVILVLMISAGIYVARSSTIGLRVIFNEKDYTNSFYALDTVASWFIDDPDTIINSATTKYTQNEAILKTVDGSLLPDFQVPNRGHIRDNVKLEVARGLNYNLSYSSPKLAGNSVTLDFLNWHATLTDKKSKRQILVGTQFVLPAPK
jgi:hypothetical protein